MGEVAHRLLFGKIPVPDGSSVSIHDVRQLSATVLAEARAHQTDWHFDQQVLHFYFAEVLSSNFGYVIKNHQPLLDPYRSIYDRITTTRPELKNAMKYYGYSVYGEDAITLTVMDDLLFLVYERARPWKLNAE